MKKNNQTRRTQDNKTETDLTMTEELFIQRQRVIKIINEAKDILNIPLPWLKVRIVSYSSNTLGRCWIEQNFITISKEMNNWEENYLRSVVWHELCHAYFGTAHDDKCILMAPTLDKPGTKEELIKALKKHSKNFKNKQNKVFECLMA
jgi:predicted metal-dependent hydrolase